MPTKANTIGRDLLSTTGGERRFARDVLTLASGTLAAQLVTVAAAPLLARFYSPDSFGIFGALLGLGTIFGAVAGLKYELAIVLERSEADALDALRLVLAITAIFTAVLLFGTFAGGSALGRFLDIQDYSLLLLMLPLFVLLFGWSHAIGFWATRQERWAAQAQGELARNLITVGGQLGLGLLAAGPFGLLAGRIAGEVGMLLRLWRGSGLDCGVDRPGHRLVADADRSRLQTLAIEHYELALYQTPRAFLNSALTHLPTLLLMACASPAIAGLYWFGTRLLRMLVTLIANAVRRVFFKGAVAIHQAGRCTRPLLIRVTMLLGLAGMLPMLVLATEGPALFAFAFGEQWRVAGQYARWLAVWCWFDLMAAPAGMLVSIHAAQRPFFCADLLAAVMGAAALAVAAASGRYELAVGLYVAVMVSRSIYGIAFMLMRTAKVAA